MSTLKEKLQQTSDRLLIFRFGNLSLTALADTPDQSDSIFKSLYDTAQTEAPDKEQIIYKILIEPFAALEGVS